MSSIFYKKTSDRKLSLEVSVLIFFTDRPFSKSSATMKRFKQMNSTSEEHRALIKKQSEE